MSAPDRHGLDDLQPGILSLSDTVGIDMHTDVLIGLHGQRLATDDLLSRQFLHPCGNMRSRSMPATGRYGIDELFILFFLDFFLLDLYSDL